MKSGTKRKNSDISQGEANNATSSVPALFTALYHKILSYLEPRLPINRAITEYATDQLIYNSCEQARDWLGRFMELLAKGGVYYDPFDTHQNFNQHLKGRNIPAKLRLALIEHSLRKNSDAPLSNESLGFINFCLDKPRLLPEVIPIICRLMMRNNFPLDPLLIDLLDLCANPNPEIREAAALSLGQAVAYLDPQRIICLLETLKTLYGDELHVREAAAATLSKALTQLGPEQMLGLQETFNSWCRAASLHDDPASLRALCTASEYVNSEQALSLLEIFKKGWRGPLRDDGAQVLGRFTAHLDSEQVLSLLNQLKVSYRDHIGYQLFNTFLAHLHPKHVLSLREIFESWCREDYVTVREAGMEGLKKVITQLDSQNILDFIETFKTWSRDDYSELRKAAAEGLSKAIAYVNSEQVPNLLEMLKTLCMDKDESVGEAVSTALSNVMPRLDSELVLSLLETFKTWCRDDNKLVRRAGAKLLSKAIPQLDSELVLSLLETLKTLCIDDKWNVRLAAAEGFSKAITHLDLQSISGFLEMFKTWCEGVDFNAKLVGATACQYVVADLDIKHILNLLDTFKQWSEHAHPDVRNAGVRAICKAIPYLDSEQILSFLAKIMWSCGNVNPYLRQAAASALSIAMAHLDSEQIKIILASQFRLDVKAIIYDGISRLWPSEIFQKTIAGFPVTPLLTQCQQTGVLRVPEKIPESEGLLLQFNSNIDDDNESTNDDDNAGPKRTNPPLENPNAVPKKQKNC